ncbi:MAG: hypothetical protein A3K19_33115 [Lentisphaerae bacterium RIFOXYB12_FULL_65_16]|nr:MAG: hypothetical protein A3K18_02255 [Lentisphaerae bacterium RIFOXYA12_64_32]OGV86977.1 MAG: hypothetical protein A3K19_33115 [Lentisphaerae bacterium RIFOXYB12_FULL_65_16]
MRLTLTVLGLGLLCGCATPQGMGVDVRVQPTPGGPRIHINGRPDPGRFFFGTRQSGMLTATPDWTEQSFEFSTGKDIQGTGTLHFRFAHAPAEYRIRDVRILDAATGATALPAGSFASDDAFRSTWDVWPPAEKNTVGTVVVEDGALHVTVRTPPGGQWPDFHLHSKQILSFAKEKVYRCQFSVQATPASTLRPTLYSVEGGVWNQIGGPPGTFLHQVALARDAGVRFISTGASSCWTPPEQTPNWEPIDSVMRDIIRVHPTALIVPRVDANAPGWWLERHPETRMTFEKGTKGKYSTVSSRECRHDAAAHLEKLCRHLCEAFPVNFAGIHPAGQNSAEWFYDDSWGPVMSGYEPPTEAAWRQYLQALGQPDAANAKVPDAARRHAAPNGFLRDPATEKDLILFNRFWQKEMADTVLELAAAVRRGTGGKKLVLFFYGYVFEFPPLHNGAPYAGHYALWQVLPSSDIDILCSPISYFDRQWTGTAPCMTAAESVMLHGKLWLNEDDTRTYLSGTKDYGGVDDLQQSLDVLRRNNAQAAIRGFATWWMDLPGEGWFDDARLWAEHSRLTPLDDALLRRGAPFEPDIAAILDEDSVCHLTGGSSTMARPLIYDARAALGRCGAPYGQYLLDDVLAGKVQSKLQIHLSTWALNSTTRDALAQARQPGTVRVWCYAPGYLTATQATAGAMAQVTGFVHRAVDLASPKSTPTDRGKTLGLTEPWGQDKQIRPLFTVSPTEGDDVLATYSDGTPSLVVRKTPQGTDVFLGTPAFTSQLVRVLAKLAGVHLYTDTDAAVWAGNGYLSVHAVQDGPLKIDTGTPANVTDAVDGTTLGNGPVLVLPVRKGETRVLRIR